MRRAPVTMVGCLLLALSLPASHGCLRFPVPDALSSYSWLRTGDRVDVYP